MRVRTLSALVVLATACYRGIDTTAPRIEQAQAVVSAPAGPSFLVGPSVAPAGLMACWPGEGNAHDVANGNDGAVSSSGASFAAGKFGQAFSFDALGGDVRIPASTMLNVAAGDGFTFSAWIFPKGNVFGPTVGAGPIVEFENGAQLWQHLQSGDPTTGLFANLAESDLIYHIHQVGGAGVVTPGQWNHAAVTYSKSAGTITIYANGVPYALTGAGSFTANTGSTLHIGSRAPGSFGSVQFTFNGLIDEVQIYNRALTAADVASLSAATGTFCAPQPRSLGITTPPAGGVSGALLGTQPGVSIRDFSNAVVTAATNPVTAAIASGPGVLSGTMTVNAVNGVANFTDLRITGAGTSTLVFTSPGLTSATSGPITITPVPTQLGVATQPGGAESGVAFTTQPVVEVRDASNKLVAGASAAVTASIASGTGALSGTTTVNTVNGVASFTNLKIAGSGSHTLNFSATGLASAVSAPFAVTQVVRALVVTTQPGNSTSGSPLGAAPVVELRDAAGLKAASATNAVTATIASGTGALSGTASVSAVAGVATFANLIVTGSGSHTLRFALAGGTPSVVSSPFAVVLAAPIQAAFNWQGFFEPIANLPKVNRQNAGESIPVKFSLGGNKGMNIFAEGYPAVQQASCSTWSLIGSLKAIDLKGNGDNEDGDKGKDDKGKDDKGKNEKHDDDKGKNDKHDDDHGGPGDNGGLRFGDGRYTFTWKTDRSWSNSCRVLSVKLTDGSVHTARFSFGR